MSNYLLVQTIIDLKVCEKFAQHLYCYWKATNNKKFNKILQEQLSKSLSNFAINCQYIDEFTNKLFEALEQVVNAFIL